MGDERCGVEEDVQVQVPSVEQSRRSSLRLTIGVVMLLAAVDNMDQNSYFSVQAWIVSEFHLTYTESAWLGVAGAIGTLITLLPLAFLADRWPRRLVVGGGAIAWASLTGLAGLAIGFSSLFVLRTLDGLGSASYDSQAAGIFYDVYPPEARSKWMSLQQLVEGIGLVVGGIAAVAIAQTLSWRVTFVVFGAVALPVAIWMLMRPEPPRALYDPGTTMPALKWQHALLQGIRDVVGSRSMLVGTAGRAIQSFSVVAIGVFLPLYLIHYRQVPTAQAELSFTMIGGVLTLGTVLGGPLASALYHRFGAGSNMLVAGGGTCAAGLLFLASFLFSWPLLLICASLAGGCIGATYAPLYALPGEIIPVEHRTFAVGVQLFFATLLGTLATVLFGFLADAFNLQASLIGFTLPLVLVGLGMLGAHSLQRRDAEALFQQRSASAVSNQEGGPHV